MADRDMRIGIRIDISISIRPLTTKFGKQVHLQDLTQMILIKQVPVASHVKLMRQTKNISTIRVPMATKLGRIVTLLGFCYQRYMTLWSRDFARSRDKQKSYLHCQSANGHQTWQIGNLPWLTYACEVTRTFDLVILQDHVTNCNHYISTIRVPVTNKVGRMVTYLDEFRPIKSHDPLILWVFWEQVSN